MNDKIKNIINIEWDEPYGPYPSFKHKYDDIGKLINKEDKGIYQIYGDHYIYGLNTLLYIGQTTETFGGRIVFNIGCHEDFFRCYR